MRHGLNEKVILVTGAGSGLGQQTAHAAAAAGARVMLVDLDGDRAAAVADAITDAGGDAQAHAFDTSLPAAHEAAVAAAVARWGHLDGAFNDGGRGGPLFSQLTDLDEAAWHQTLEANVSGLWFAMRAQAAQMRSQQSGGSIVNAATAISGASATLTHALNASKHAVVGLTQSVATEYGAGGIRVNAVCPGWSSGAAAHLPPFQAALQHTPGAAALVTWLLSDAAAFMTGTALPIPEAAGVP